MNYTMQIMKNKGEKFVSKDYRLADWFSSNHCFKKNCKQENWTSINYILSHLPGYTIAWSRLCIIFCIFVMLVIRDDFINFADDKVFADFSFAADWIVPQ